MLEEFQNLSDNQRHLLRQAVPLITVLIAGADGKVDSKELAWSKKLTQIRAFSYDDNLSDYYLKIGETFTDDLDVLNKTLPSEVELRTKVIQDKLAQLNPILEALTPLTAKELYESWRSFATHVARASGGFLDFGKVSKEEKELLDLSAIRPIKP